MPSDDPAVAAGASPDSVSPPPDAGIAFGHFLVPRRADGSPWELGRGAMGVTYRAFDTSLRTEVALKVIRAEQVSEDAARRRFQREARAAAKIRHPNIASVLYLGEQGGEFFYAMEFIAGRSLDDLLKATAGPLPPAVAVALAAQAAAALNAAHRREVVHRDLKPANLMLLEGDALDHEDERTEAAGNRQLKIIDFGLARSFGANRQDDSLVTQTFAGFIGTPAYASPEQASGEHDLDGRSDLYSLGIILWQTLTGRLPFTGRVVEVLGKHQFQPPPFELLAAANVPAPIIGLLTGLLLKVPAERQPQTASELRVALDRLLRSLASDTSPASAALVPAADDPERTSDTTATPTVGTTLVARYRLGREVAQGDGGQLFLAADNSAGERPVAIKLLSLERLSAGPAFLANVETALNCAREHPHSILLAHDTGPQRSGGAVFYVREWAEGFSLDELFRARNGALRAAEVFRLLDVLPATLDFAAQHRFPLLEPALHKLFVVSKSAGNQVGDWPGLRSRAVEDWPAFALKLNPLGFPPVFGSVNPNTGLTQRGIPQGSSNGAPDPVVALARLTRELLGAPAGGLGPVAALNDEANAVLRRALDPTTAGTGAGRAAFADAASFWRALRSTAVVPLASALTDDQLDSAQTIRADATGPEPPTQPETPEKSLSESRVPPSLPPIEPDKRRRRNTVLLAVSALALLLALAGGSWWLWGIERPRQQRAEQKLHDEEQRQAKDNPTQHDLRRGEEQRERLAAEEKAKREREAAEQQAAARAKAQEEERQRGTTRATSPTPSPSRRSTTSSNRSVVVDANFFYQNLSDDGTWFSTTEYGDVWEPKVSKGNADWRPYTDGQWAKTDQGWQWVSNESFGWACYHYGRWTNNVRGLGWVWVPGYDWAPAWVSWRTSEDEQATGSQTNSPKVLNVPADYSRIQAALDAAQPGDTVLVGPGIYNEALTLRKENISLRGTDRNKVTVRKDVELDDCLTVSDCRSGRISGFTFEHIGNNAAGYHYCVVLLERSSVEIRDCVVRQGGGHGIGVSGRSNGANGSTISDCTVEGCGWSGILVYGNGAQATLKNNTCRKNKQSGIGFDQSASSSAEGNTCEDNGNCGILATGNGCNPTLIANRCTGNNWGIYKMNGAQPRIARDNVVRGNRMGQIGP